MNLKVAASYSGDKLSEEISNRTSGHLPAGIILEKVYTDLSEEGEEDGQEYRMFWVGIDLGVPESASSEDIDRAYEAFAGAVQSGDIYWLEFTEKGEY